MSEELRPVADGRSRCQYCQREVDGMSGMCLSCYSRRLVPCRVCMRLAANGAYYLRGEYRGRKPRSCKSCGNERYLLID